MTLRKHITNALSEYKKPIEENYYEGSEREWFTWNIADERAIEHEAGKAIVDCISVQIHLFLEKDTKYEALKKGIKNSLIKNGFTYPSVKILFEDDSKKRHIIFSCEIVAESEEDNE